MNHFSGPTERTDWVDYAKGFCIVFVVLMHSTLGVEHAAGREGWLHVVADFTKPFRIPDFFLISGLFLARVLDRDWRTFLDRRVVHFVYLYVLWINIQFAVKAPGFATELGAPALLKMYALAYIEPFGTLWFIYLLPIFAVLIKALRAVSPWAIFAIAAILDIAQVSTGFLVVDEFCRQFVFFFAGYWLAAYIFAFASWAQTRPFMVHMLLALWASVNGFLVFNGFAGLAGLSLLLAFLGAGAIVAASALMAQRELFAPLRYCGQHTLPIYLAFFLFMAASRVALLKTGLITDIGTIAALVTLIAVLGPLIMHRLTRGTPLRFLFERPACFVIAQRPRLQPAE